MKNDTIVEFNQHLTSIFGCKTKIFKESVEGQSLILVSVVEQNKGFITTENIKKIEDTAVSYDLEFISVEYLVNIANPKVHSLNESEKTVSYQISVSLALRFIEKRY